MAKPKAKKALLKLLKTTFSGLSQCEEIDVKDAYRLSDKKVKVHIQDYPFQINLFPDSKTLHIYPEQALNGSSKTSPDKYILFDPDTFYSEISGFYRLDVDEKITLGGDNAEQRAFLHISEDTPARKLSIGNDEGWLTFKSHNANPKSCVSPLLKDKKVNRIIHWRIKKLRKLRDIFGGPIELLSSDSALALIREVNDILLDEAHRPKDKSGRPGGVVAVPDTSRAIIVGDLHARADNLLVILSQNGFLEALEEDRASLVILGDAVHPEGDVPLDEMEPSMLMMDVIFKLKVRFPRNVFYLRGNHDSYAEEIAKRGIPQGLLWANALKRVRGKVYQDEMSRFYEQLPCVAYSRHFIACHAAPPVSSITLDQIINIRDNRELCKELNANRMRAPNRPMGYSKSDIKRFRKCMNVAPDVPVIVGHTCLSMDETIWENVGDIQNHHVIYASDTRQVGVMTQIGDNIYPFRYPVEPMISIINALGE